jgi:hypothetical protein
MGCAFLWPVDRSLCPASSVIVWQWCGLRSTQRQTQKLILSPSPTTKTRLLSFSRTQCKVVIGLLTRHNTLRRHLHLMGLKISPLDRRCRAEDENTLCVCVKPWHHSDIHIQAAFSWTQKIKSLNLRAIWNFSKRTGLT